MKITMRASPKAVPTAADRGKCAAPGMLEAAAAGVDDTHAVAAPSNEFVVIRGNGGISSSVDATQTKQKSHDEKDREQQDEPHAPKT